MPAGRGSQCQRCYLETLANKRTQINCAAFSSETMTRHFEAFGRWLSATRGAAKGGQTIHRFLPFFLKIERTWGGIPKYGELLEHFGARRLRAVLLAVRWMEASGLVEPDADAREANSDRRRIEARLAQFPEGTVPRATLESYYAVLEERVDAGQSSIRSIRLALTAAAGLVETSLGLGRTVPNQRALAVYLTRAPGQRAAVSGFVTHLRERNGTAVALPQRDRRAARRRQRRKLREELLGLMHGNGNCSPGVCISLENP